MIQVGPGEHAFEIFRSIRVEPGSYSCRLEVLGPAGYLAREVRGCRQTGTWAGAQAETLPTHLMAQISAYRGEAGAAEEPWDRTGDVEAGDVRSEDRSLSLEEKLRDPSSVSDQSFSGLSGSGARRPASQGEAGGRAAGSSPDASPSVAALSLKEAQAGSVQEDLVREEMIVGSKESRKYHSPSCRYARKIKEENRVYFKDAEDAERQGYLPCKVCLG